MMNIKRAKQEIKDTIEAYLRKDAYGAYMIPSVRQRPILLIGPPGVGKTQIMEQISQECGIGLAAYTITHHTRQSAVGLPFIVHKQYGGKEYAVTEYTMSEIVASIYDKIELTGLKEGILFIDEINCVSETLAPTMLQFLQGKSFGNHKIPEGWIIVAAGNPPEYNKSVREFDVVTLDRIRRIEIEPDYEAWKEYAVKVNIHPAVQSYLSIRRENFCRVETTVDGRLFATPRGWEDLSELIRVYEKIGKSADREVVGEYIQFPKIAKDFANYLELYYKYRDDYRIEEVLNGVRLPESAFDKLQKAPFDERISVVGLLLAGVNERFRTVCRTAEEMELRMELLRGLQKEGAFAAGRSGREALEAYAKLVESFTAEQKKKKESGLLSRMEERRGHAVTEQLERDFRKLRETDRTVDADRAPGADQEGKTPTAEDIWNRQRELFAADSDAYEAVLENAGKCLEFAFDFMEAAFADGQEMVLFVTELNTGFYSVKFLQEYTCERYYEYNRNLLFSTEEDAVKEAIRAQNR